LVFGEGGDFGRVEGVLKAESGGERDLFDWREVGGDE